MIKSIFSINILSLLSEFDFEGYIPKSWTWKKKWCIYFSSLVIIFLHDNTWPATCYQDDTTEPDIFPYLLPEKDLT